MPAHRPLYDLEPSTEFASRAFILRDGHLIPTKTGEDRVVTVRFLEIRQEGGHLACEETAVHSWGHDGGDDGVDDEGFRNQAIRERLST